MQIQSQKSSGAVRYSCFLQNRASVNLPSYAVIASFELTFFFQLADISAKNDNNKKHQQNTMKLRNHWKNRPNPNRTEPTNRSMTGSVEKELNQLVNLAHIRAAVSTSAHAWIIELVPSHDWLLYVIIALAPSFAQVRPFLTKFFQN